MNNKKFEPKSTLYKVTKKDYVTSRDPRGTLPVYEYSANGDTFMWDRETGEVYMTAIWKALGFTKNEIKRTLQDCPKSSIKKIRGGFLNIQGTWLCYDTAKFLCKKLAKSIGEQLVPIFGPDTSKQPLKPSRTQNKPSTGLINRNMNKQLIGLTSLDNSHSGKRKRDHFNENVDVYPKKSTLNVKLLDLFFGPDGNDYDHSNHTSTENTINSDKNMTQFYENQDSSHITTSDQTALNFHEAPILFQQDNDGDESVVSDIYNGSCIGAISNDGKTPSSPIYTNQDKNTSTPLQIVPKFRVVPYFYPQKQQYNDDATVPLYFNDIPQYPLTNKNIDDPLKKKNSCENRNPQNKWKEMADTIEATVILHGLANNFQNMQQTVPENVIVDDMEFNILWE
ncbi:hypothetical protein BJ944DRAFT_175775 [Cunninghamella echinulata]|nr:hypothetical protein BJ944DRAFT_175775 [Cunninghamella echinulata]